MKISRTEPFRRDFLALSPDVRKAASKQIAQLLINHRHPSLRLERIEGHRGIFSVRVTRRVRMSLEFVGNDELRLRHVLDHDDLYRSP